MDSKTPELISVFRLPIRLGQFLKLIEIASDGGEATSLIANGHVDVNAVAERRRGRKLFAGDHIGIRGKVWKITSSEFEGK